MKLEEANFDLGNIFDENFFISPKAEQDYLNKVNGDFDTIISDARNGKDIAMVYLIKQSKNRLLNVFWKYFIGSNLSNKGKAQRISNGDFDDFCNSLIVEGAYKAIKAFDESKYLKDTDKLHSWEYYLGQYVMKEAFMENNRNYGKDPTEGAVHPDDESITSSDTAATGWDKVSQNSSIEGRFADASNIDEFDKSWKQLCHDSALRNDKKYPWNKVLSDILSGNEVSQVAAKYGASKSTIRNKIFKTSTGEGLLNSLMKKYNITQEELVQKMHDKGADMLVKELR